MSIDNRAARIDPEGVDLGGRRSAADAHGLLDRLSLCVLECGADGWIRYANAAAREALDDADGVLVDDGHIRAADPGAQARLQAALLAAGRPLGPVETAVRVLRPSNRPDWRLILSPHRSPDGEAAVVIQFRDEARGDAGLAERAAALFGLTPSEADLGLRLVQGQTPEQAAVSRGVSVGTVRTQIKGLMAKTATRRQVELAVLLACIPGVRVGAGRGQPSRSRE